MSTANIKSLYWAGKLTPGPDKTKQLYNSSSLLIYPVRIKRNMTPPQKGICNKIWFCKTSKHLFSEDFLSIDSNDVASMWCVPTSQTRLTASSLEHPVCYQILICLLCSCLLGFTWLNTGEHLDLLKTLIHSISKPNFSCLSVPHRFIQIFITQKTLNLTPLSTTTLWDRLEWNCSWNCI